MMQQHVCDRGFMHAAEDAHCQDSTSLPWQGALRCKLLRWCLCSGGFNGLMHPGGSPVNHNEVILPMSPATYKAQIPPLMLWTHTPQSMQLMQYVQVITPSFCVPACYARPVIYSGRLVRTGLP